MADKQQEEVFDSPTGWVRSHIQEYVETDGAKGHQWRGYPTLLLTTRGRKSGKLRRTALIYGQDGPNYILVASQGGAPKHPQWYLNLAANPEVALQVGADKLRGRARTATPRGKAAPVAIDDAALSALRRLPGKDRARATGGDCRAYSIGKGKESGTAWSCDRA
jgi:deazaflavin-dependent oxidoreductase (nitroreductase family)